MKAMTIKDFGGVEKLTIQDLPTPSPSENEVQIEVRYTAVNPVDWKIREGYLKSAIPHEFPLILGWDAAGIVTAVGKKVKNFKLGDEVFAYCRKPTIKWGTYAEFVCIDADKVAMKPQNINFAQAAAIPLVGLTAWQALFDAAKLKKGETILIHAGAGGVGGMAIQFAKHAGAKVIATASPENHDYVKKLGADHVIDYHGGFVDKLKNIAPEGVDIVFDTVGGQALRDSYQVVKSHGRIVGIVEKPDSTQVAHNHIQCSYVFVEPNGKQLNQIGNLISHDKIKVPNIEEMDLSEAAKAQEKLRRGHTKGKIVLKIKN